MKEFPGKEMGKKNILIVISSPLHPLNSMSKVRVINQIKGLSSAHQVDLLFLYTKSDDVKETIKISGSYCSKVFPVKTFTQSIFFKVLKKTILKKLFGLISLPMDYYIPSNKLTSRRIAEIVDKGNYDVVISHYWYGSGFMRYLKKPILKCIDAHYVVEENINNFKGGKYNHIDNGSYGKLLNKELFLQKKYFTIADLIIVNSGGSKELLGKSFDPDLIIVIPNGQDLSYFLNYNAISMPHLKKNLLFYGALSSQFNSKALKRILMHIFPEIKKQIPDVKMIILGSNPPEWLGEFSNRQDIIIKGFVEDIRPVLADSYLSLIPLESGSGFRGRTIELMAMGVPVIGTHNALDCLEFEHSKHGYIFDDDESIIKMVLVLFNDQDMRDKIALNALNFVKEKFTIESTFGLLSQYFCKLN
jgi:glycosyltransferase involved in cell wall biosynthesis